MSFMVQEKTNKKNLKRVKWTHFTWWKIFHFQNLEQTDQNQNGDQNGDQNSGDQNDEQNTEDQNEDQSGDQNGGDQKERRKRQANHEEEKNNDYAQLGASATTTRDK